MGSQNRMVQDGMANEAKKPLTLGRGKLELKKTVETGQVRLSFSHGRTKVVQVERKRKRQFEMGADGKVQEVKSQAPGTLKKASAEEAADAMLKGVEGNKQTVFFPRFFGFILRFMHILPTPLQKRLSLAMREKQ